MASTLAKHPQPAGHSADWERVLGVLEDRLAELRNFSSEEAKLLEVPQTLWQPPAGIGDLPAALAPRASALLRAIESLKPVLEVRRDEAARQLRAISSVPRDPGVASIYLDSVG